MYLKVNFGQVTDIVIYGRLSFCWLQMPQGEVCAATQDNNQNTNITIVNKSKHNQFNLFFFFL